MTSKRQFAVHLNAAILEFDEDAEFNKLLADRLEELRDDEQNCLRSRLVPLSGVPQIPNPWGGEPPMVIANMC